METPPCKGCPRRSSRTAPPAPPWQLAPDDDVEEAARDVRSRTVPVSEAENGLRGSAR